MGVGGATCICVFGGVFGAGHFWDPSQVRKVRHPYDAQARRGLAPFLPSLWSDSEEFLRHSRKRSNDLNAKTGEPGVTAQRSQLSRVVLAHAPRQLGSWLTWDVDLAACRQEEKMKKLSAAWKRRF